jgi:hypothetical protein
MRLIIAGGRRYKLTPQDLDFLDKLYAFDDSGNQREDPGVSRVLSGGAAGADAGGEMWARTLGIPVTVYSANWEKFGLFAGPKRNLEMALYADAVVLFPGGIGTESMGHTSRPGNCSNPHLALEHDRSSNEIGRPTSLHCLCPATLGRVGGSAD